MMAFRALHLCRRLVVCAAVCGALISTVVRAQDVDKILEILEGIPDPSQVIEIAGQRAADRAAAAAAEGRPKADQLPRFVLRNGNRIRGKLKEKTVPVETPYGVLKLPIEKVVDIHFSLRVQDDVGKRVDSAIERLAADDFTTREAASSELRNLGFDAVPALRLVLTSTDEEVRKRAGEILERFGDTEDETLPLLTPRDRVRLTDVTLEGVIPWDKIAVETEYGDLNLDRRDVVRVSLREVGPRRQQLSVPSSALVPGWLATKVRIKKGQKLKIVASGQMGIPDRGEFCGPDGLRRQSRAYPGSRELSLVGRIGPKGKLFAIGSEFKGPAAASGRLSLGVIPFRYSRGVSGVYDVSVEVR